MITLIACVAKNGVIGKDGKLPWGRIDEDMAHFYKHTYGRVVVMGRKTYESIGQSLPGRFNIVLSSEKIVGVVTCDNMYNIVAQAKRTADEVMIIGGGQVYRDFLTFADKAILTELDKEYEGDTFFPSLKKAYGWELVESEKFRLGRFNTYVRVNDEN